MLPSDLSWFAVAALLAEVISRSRAGCGERRGEMGSAEGGRH